MRPVEPGQLPSVDMHRIRVAAATETVWLALVATLERSLDTALALRFAPALGAEPARSDGRFPDAASTLPAFRVVHARPTRELVLAGRHRFATYALTFRIEPAPDGVRLEAETRAAFPGWRGRAYRALVIGTGGHVLVVRRLLRAVKRRSERSTTTTVWKRHKGREKPSG